MTETDEITLPKRRTFKFEREFIKDLIDKIPQKILDFDCEIINGGEVRFDNNKLSAVYLAFSHRTRIKELGTPSRLKFEYVGDEFIFRAIYIWPEDAWDYDGQIEHRYDQHMNLLSKYKYIRKDLLIPSPDCGKIAGIKIYDAQDSNSVGGHYIIYDLPGKFSSFLNILKKDNMIIDDTIDGTCTYCVKENIKGANSIYLRVDRN